MDILFHGIIKVRHNILIQINIWEAWPSAYLLQACALSPLSAFHKKTQFLVFGCQFKNFIYVVIMISFWSLQLITDVNIAVAVEAIQATGNLASGLRTHFSGNSRFLLPVLLVSIDTNLTLIFSLHNWFWDLKFMPLIHWLCHPWLGKIRKVYPPSIFLTVTFPATISMRSWTRAELKPTYSAALMS